MFIKWVSQFSKKKKKVLTMVLKIRLDWPIELRTRGQSGPKKGQKLVKTENQRQI